MTTFLTTLTVDQLRRAIAIKEQIETLQKEFASLFGAPAPAVTRGAAKKRGISAAGRARIAAAQKARWAKQKKAAAGAAKPAKKGKLSPEGRARIIAAQKARWAKAKAKQGK